MITLILTLMLMMQLADPPRKANAAFKDGQYEDAVRLYEDAIAKDPAEARLTFNLGNAFSMLGRKEESIEAYNRFKASDPSPTESSMADYNIGTMLAEEDPDAAIESLISSLRGNPYDEDAKHNLEMLLKKRQQQQDQEQDQQQDQDQNQDQQQDQQQQQDQDQNQDQQQQDQQQNQDGTPPPGQDQQPQQQQPRIQPREAEALLDALEQREKDLLRAMKKESSTESKSDKDW